MTALLVSLLLAQVPQACSSGSCQSTTVRTSDPSTVTSTVITDGTTLNGNGGSGAPLAINLSAANTWLVRQVFQVPSGGARGAINMSPIALGPTAAQDGDWWVTSTTANVKVAGVTYQIAPTTSGSWPTRKTATDANSYLYWTLDEGSLPLANGIVAQGSNGNFDVNGNVGFNFSVPGMFSTSVFSPFVGARVGAQASASTALSPASPISIWFWLKSGGGAANACNSIDGVFKAYRAAGTWNAPFASVLLGINGTCQVVTQVVTGTNGSGSVHAVTGLPFIRLGAWNLVWMTYDGATLSTSINNYPPITAGVTGALDYNSNAGRWGLGMDEANNTSWAGQIDEVHVDTVARTTSYFQTVWQTATGEGGQ